MTKVLDLLSGFIVSIHESSHGLIFFYLMLIKAKVIRFYVWLATNFLPNKERMLKKLAMEFSGNELNQTKASPSEIERRLCIGITCGVEGHRVNEHPQMLVGVG